MAKNTMIKRYSKASGKNNVGVSAGKGAVEGVSSILGGGLAAAGGITGPLLGFGLIFLGHLVDDKTGVIKAAGSGAIGYSVANAFVNRDNARTASVNGLGAVKGNVKQRLLDFKENLVQAFYLDKLMKKKEADDTSSERMLGSIDTSELDLFIQSNVDSAKRHVVHEVENDLDFDEYEDVSDEFDEADAEEFDEIDDQSVDTDLF